MLPAVRAALTRSTDAVLAEPCTEGRGLILSRDGEVVEIAPGDTVWTPPGERHCTARPQTTS